MHATALHFALILVSQTPASPGAESTIIPPPIPSKQSVSPQGVTDDETQPTPANPLRFVPPRISPAPPTPIDSAEPTEKSVLISPREPNKIEPKSALPLTAPETNSEVIRAAAQQPLSPSTGTVEAASAKLILADALAMQTSNALKGSPVSLFQVLQRVGGSTKQRQAVKSYWHLSSAVADYHYAIDETNFLASLATPASTHEQAQLRLAQAASRARQGEATLAAVAAQYDLGELMSSSSNNGLPLPSDLPLVGRYQTRFDELFANRPAPSGVGRINATLPLYFSLINARADSVDAGQHSLKTAIDAYQSGQIGIDNVLQQYVQLRDQRIAFLAVIRDYNHAIADYALNVARPGLTVREVVSMLIAPPADVPVARQAKLDSRPRVKPSVGIVPVKPAPTFVPTGPQAELPVDLSPKSIVPKSPAPITLDPR